MADSQYNLHMVLHRNYKLYYTPLISEYVELEYMSNGAYSIYTIVNIMVVMFSKGKRHFQHEI